MTEQRRQIEREWIAVATERDLLKAEASKAGRSGDPQAEAAAWQRVVEATIDCNEIMARYRQITYRVLPPPQSSLDIQKANVAREIVAELTNLIAKTDKSGLQSVNGPMLAARDAARKVIEETEGRYEVE